MNKRIDSIFYNSLAYKLNDKRIKLGYSFKYLSKITGISSAQLDDYFNGKYRIKNETYEIICKALEISPKIKIDLEIG